MEEDDHGDEPIEHGNNKSNPHKSSKLASIDEIRASADSLYILQSSCRQNAKLKRRISEPYIPRHINFSPKRGMFFR